jgi:hypothetical protein
MIRRSQARLQEYLSDPLQPQYNPLQRLFIFCLDIVSFSFCISCTTLAGSFDWSFITIFEDDLISSSHFKVLITLVDKLIGICENKKSESTDADQTMPKGFHDQEKPSTPSIIPVRSATASIQPSTEALTNVNLDLKSDLVCQLVWLVLWSETIHIDCSHSPGLVLCQY